MFNKIFNRLLRSKNANYIGKSNKLQNSQSVSKNIDEIKKMMQERFRGSIDVIIYEFEAFNGLKSLVVYISDMIKREELDRDILNPFITQSIEFDVKIKSISSNDIKKMLPVSNIQEIEDINVAINLILGGNCALFIDSISKAFAIPFNNWETRSVEEPGSEPVIRGPKEGFIESININRTLIRRKIRNENLTFENLQIGKQTKTNVNIAYINGIVNLDVLAEVRRRLTAIDTDSILDAGYIEEYIEDSHISPISTVANTQKPDIVSAKILEGRVAILCDGSPHVLTVPHLFIESIQASEDYYSRPYIATLLRIIRIIALVFSIVLPAFYVALESYHQDMIPSTLFITMVGANMGTPFPSVLEALLMVMAFEFLKESGTRMPRPIGSAISIVGALVLGDAAVKAGIVSTDLVVVIAFTAVSTFIVPALNEMISLYRLILLALSGIMGIYGITAGVFVMIFHSASLRSFGVPYLSPLSPINIESLKDFTIRFPLWAMKKRPGCIEKRNKKRRV